MPVVKGAGVEKQEVGVGRGFREDASGQESTAAVEDGNATSAARGKDVLLVHVGEEGVGCCCCCGAVKGQVASSFCSGTMCTFLACIARLAYTVLVTSLPPSLNSVDVYLMTYRFVFASSTSSSTTRPDED